LEFSIEQTRSEVDAILILFALLRDERAIFEPWLNLVTSHGVQGKTTHDARLVAAMLRHGVSHLLTFNTGDFVRYSEIAAVHPDDVLAGRVLESTE
jgi:predicted nucleic acid-binding protein